MQGAVDILVAVTYTYISEKSPAQNAHAENSKTFINQGTLSFLHISNKKKIKPLRETLQFLTMVLMKTSSGIGCSIIWYMVTKALEEQDPTDGGSKIFSNVTIYQLTQHHLPQDLNLKKVDMK